MTALLSRWMFGKVQSAINQTFTGSAQVMRRTEVADSSGGFTVTYVLAHTYPCSYSRYPVRPLDRELQPRVQVVTAYKFSFANDADVQAIDRLIVGSRTFEVVECDVSNLPLFRDAFCQEIQ